MTFDVSHSDHVPAPRFVALKQFHVPGLVQSTSRHVFALANAWRLFSHRHVHEVISLNEPWNASRPMQPL